MQRILAVLLVMGVVMATMVSSAGAQSGTGQVTVVHGVPGLTVDVYVNNQLTLEDFAPGTITNELTLPAGAYQIAIRPANAAAGSAPAIAGSANLQAGANVSIVAHLSAAGQPTLSVFANDVSAIESDKTRIVVRHTAAAPAVDVRSGQTVLFNNLTNPNQAGAVVPAGGYPVALAPAGTSTIVFDAGTIPFAAGTAHFVYAVGSLTDGSFTLLVQAVGGLDPSAARTAAQPQAGCAYFEETKHNACAGFLAFWHKYGGLAAFGMPLTEEFRENGVTVQYFERARFEWHPGSAPERYDVVLGRVGAELLDQR